MNIVAGVDRGWRRADMIEHEVRTYPSAAGLARPDQLAWKIAEVAADPVAVDRGRHRDGRSTGVIDNAAVAAASLTRAPVVAAAREQALAHPSVPAPAARARPSSASTGGYAPGVGGLGQRRRRARARLPRHVPGGRVLAPRRQHPADPRGRPARRRATARPGPRHRHRLRDPDRPGEGDLPARAQDRPRRPPRPVGGGRHRHAARPDAETIYQAIGQALHTTTATRQSRKGEISTLEGVRAGLRRQDGDRGGRPGDARRRLSPTPIYEGEDGVIAWLLDGPEARVRGAAARAGRGQARHPRHATPRSTRPSTRRRRWIDLARAARREHPELRDPARTSSDRARTPATTPTT